MPANRVPRTYWDYDPTDPLRCPRCDWEGTTTAEDTQSFLDVRCPSCDGPILKISWPSTEETRAAAEAGNAAAARELTNVEAREALQAEAARIELRDVSQLPDLPDGPVAIVWDQVESDGEEWTVLRDTDGRELFRELAYWEGIDRFVEVVAVLARGFGTRLRSVTPTPTSELYLYGDQLGAPRRVDGINARLRGEEA
ncbi:hypothetical protein [Patulibacter minatonensis]|uniref:hypothetical protein n=1 Tax=Patulibacter minatonensis TaxID=298163 RepID=UPI0012FAF35B|nr:hypothetical protein [Patulibacter minatonensis]